jgi:hypothetical protein
MRPYEERAPMGEESISGGYKAQVTRRKAKEKQDEEYMGMNNVKQELLQVFHFAFSILNFSLNYYSWPLLLNMFIALALPSRMNVSRASAAVSRASFKTDNSSF